MHLRANGNMLQFLRRSFIRVPPQRELQPRAFQQLTLPPSSQLRRSVDTKPDDSKKKENNEAKLRTSLRRPSGKYAGFCRKMDVENHERRQQKLWAQVKRAEAQLPLGNVPRRKPALERIYADMFAQNTRSLYLSADHVLSILLVRDLRGFFLWYEEDWELAWANFPAQARSAELWILAPTQEVGVLLRL